MSSELRKQYMEKRRGCILAEEKWIMVFSRQHDKALPACGYQLGRMSDIHPPPTASPYAHPPPHSTEQKDEVFAQALQRPEFCEEEMHILYIWILTSLEASPTPGQTLNPWPFPLLQWL